MADKVILSVDELFSMIKRSSLPTVLVEGETDIICYRNFEKDITEFRIDILQAGGKESVLEIRKRLKGERLEFPILFIVDKDAWIYTGVPKVEIGDDLITTEGYSIENDLFIDGELLRLLDLEEHGNFLSDVTRFNRWYAKAVKRHLDDRSNEFRTHPGKVLDDRAYYDSYLNTENGDDFPVDLHEAISRDYQLAVRGKSLFSIIHRQLSRKNRRVKFGENQLMEIGICAKGPNYVRLRDMVRCLMEKHFAQQSVQL